MKDYDYHSLFYYGALSKIQGYRGNNGGSLQAPKELGVGMEFNIGYDPARQGFPHQYMREEFARSRNKYLVASKDGQHTVLMKFENGTERATIYRKALRALFPKDYPVAKRELETLMGKFYSLESDKYYPGVEIDFSTDARGSHLRVDRMIRKT